MSLLDSVEDFRGLYGLSEEELGALCAELRERILDVTLKNGGHLSSSLGAVELTVALLRVFNPDSDKIIFDVGHQSYAYKLLTKRLDRFPTLRRKGGIAGFPRMDESPYDFFTTGHSSTSISAAMGYAKARDLKRESYEVVAVIGDGALLNGVSFEALNAMASVKSKVIIVLNDNKMSINPRVGGMASHLAKLAVNPTYKKFKDYVKYQCAGRRNGESVHQALSQIKQKLKSLLLPTNIFEELNISYWGPFNGHNVTEMEEVFRLARHYDEPLLIHVLTQKGKGCKAAEENPAFFHGVGPMTKIDAHGARALRRSRARPEGDGRDGGDEGRHEARRLREALSAAILRHRHRRGAHARLRRGARRSGNAPRRLHLFDLPAKSYGPGDARYMPAETARAARNRPRVSWLRAVPNMTLAAPRDAVDLEFFVEEWRRRGIPAAIRYPRGKAPLSLARETGAAPAEWGKCEVLREGSEICLIGVGSTVPMMLEAAEEISKRGAAPTVVDLRFIKPLDIEGLLPVLASHKTIVTAEENALAGGVGEEIAALMKERGIAASCACAGVPDRFIAHATRAQQWEECGLTVENIMKLCGVEK